MNKNINKNLAIQKGLINYNDERKYVILENLYKYLFEYYLKSKINIKKYDDILLNSNLDFGISSPTKRQIGNNLNNYLNLKYIYLINNFFIEKLSEEDINKLQNSLKNNNLIPNNELFDIINRTYKNVIKNNYTKKGYVQNKYNIYYGNFSPNNIADNDALVLKIFYGKNKIKLNDTDYLINIKNKKEFLKKFANNLKNDIEKKLNINVNILFEKIPN